MPTRARKLEELRHFVLDNIEGHPGDLARLITRRFRLSRQAAVSHLNRLVHEDIIEATGRTKARRYSLKRRTWVTPLTITLDTEEDVIWRDKMLPLVADLPANVVAICNHGLTEMLNNVVDHSESDKAFVGISRDALKTTISVIDAGVGIFNKIQRTFGLHDPRHALLELAKGKLTTDSRRHSGEGVFFTSRMFDEFRIVSGSMYYQRVNKEDDEWLIDAGDSPPQEGTTVVMVIRNDASQTIKEVFDRYASEDSDFGFSRTHVPIRLAMYEGDQMLSRSQAKRILARVDRFAEVILDFRGVTEIGQAFADEIFRVFANEHPGVRIVTMFTTRDIDRMIERAKSSEAADSNGTRQLSLLP